MSIFNPSGRTPIVGDVDAFDCEVTGAAWPWAAANADVIAAHWGELSAAKPALFDGEVIIATDVAIERGRLLSHHAVVRYSALKYWQDQGFPRADAFNLFGAGVVVTRDGAALLGVMGAHTGNAGFTYFPCGTPDAGDIKDGKLDIEGSIIREIEEETGLGADHVRLSEQKWISWDGPLFCCACRVDCEMTASEAEEITGAHQAGQKRPELEKMIFARSLEDIADLQVPLYAQALLRQVLA